MKTLPITQTVLICRNTYISSKNQIDFASQQEQYDYFSGKAKFNLNKMTYIRQNNFWKGMVKVPLLYQSLVDCDYLVFSNPTENGSKRFFCKIINVQYIDTYTQSIDFEVDFYQTFLFDFQIQNAFTEREHYEKMNDIIGLNTEPEPSLFDNAKVVIKNYEIRDFIASNDLILIMYVKPAQPVTEIGNIRYPILQSVVYPGDVWAFPYNADGILQFQKKMLQLSLNEGVTAGVFAWEVEKVYIVPNVNNVLGITFVDNEYKFDNNFDTLFVQKIARGSATIPTELLQFKNKKTYQAPFLTATLSVSTAGKMENIDIARFPLKLSGDAPDIHYAFTLDFDPYPRLVVWLENYDENTLEINGNKYDADNAMVIELPEVQFTQIGGLGNVMKKLVALGAGQVTVTQSSEKLPTENEVAGMALDGASFDELMNIRTAEQAESERRVVEKSANDYRLSSGLVDAAKSFLTESKVSIKGAIQQQDFTQGFSLALCKAVISFVIVRDIQQYDEFMTRYGYAVNQFKVPATKSRPHWNYVKTRFIDITGNVPEQAKTSIAAMFNAGFTIWHDDILNYGREN